MECEKANRLWQNAQIEDGGVNAQQKGRAVESDSLEGKQAEGDGRADYWESQESEDENSGKNQKTEEVVDEPDIAKLPQSQYSNHVNRFSKHKAGVEEAPHSAVQIGERVIIIFIVVAVNFLFQFC